MKKWQDELWDCNCRGPTAAWLLNCVQSLERYALTMICFVTKDKWDRDSTDRVLSTAQQQP
jgi:hypothetical protein